MKVKLMLLLWFFTTLSFSQTPEGLRRVLEKDFYIDCYVAISPKKMKYNDTLSYYWFKAQKIHHTQGVSAGYPLHGTYSKHYNSGQIAEKGTFDKGLKSGVWRTWYISGKIKAVRHYKNGILNGNFELYNENGELVTKGHYKNGIQKENKAIEEEDEKSDKKKKQKVLKNPFKKNSSENTTEDNETSEQNDKKKKNKRKDKKAKN